MLPWTCLVWNLISDIPSIPSLEDSHAMNIRPISMKFTRNTFNDPKLTHGKNHINPKRSSYKFDIEQKQPLLLAMSVVPDPLLLTWLNFNFSMEK